MSPSAESLSAELASELEACRKLVGDEPDAEALDLGDLRAEVDEQLAAEEGLRGKLRSLPTSQRIGLVVLAVLALGGVTAGVTPRHDLGAYPMARMGVVLAILTALTAVATTRLLRPLHLPPPGALSGRLLLLAGLLTPFVISLVPLHGHVGGPAGEGAAFAVSCAKCLGFGGAMGLPVLLLAFAARRAKMDGAAIAALAGVAAGLAGNLTLQLHCPIVDPLHLVFGHALLLLIFGAAAASWRPSRA